MSAAALVVMCAAGTATAAAEPPNNEEQAAATSWDALLDTRDLRRILVRPSGDREADVARAVKIIETVSNRHRDLIAPERIGSIAATVHFAEVDRTYRRVVLEPLSAVSEKEARVFFETHRESFRRPAGAKLLEIFLWAPGDLPELRAARLEMLRGIRKEARDEEAFSAAAEKHSDATSYQNGGRIGTLMADQVDGRLHEVIVGDFTGLSEILSTAEGHYLFFVLSRVPRRERSFDEVADRITNRLTAQRLEATRARDDERLTDQHSIDLDPQDGLFSVAGTTYSLTTAGLSSDLHGSKLEEATARRALGIAREVDLKTLEIEVETPPERLAMALYAAIYPVLLDARLAASPLQPATAGVDDQSSKAPRTIQRWDLEMLTLPDDGGQEALFALLRIRHDLNNRAALEEVRATLKKRFDLTAEVVRRTGLLAPDAAAMGPEIYRTLKHHLEIGEISRPLHLADSHRFVMVRLTGRTLDAEAGVKERTARARARDHRSIRAALEQELLGDAELRRGVDSDDLLERQRRQ